MADALALADAPDDRDGAVSPPVRPRASAKADRASPKRNVLRVASMPDKGLSDPAPKGLAPAPSRGEPASGEHDPGPKNRASRNDTPKRTKQTFIARFGPTLLKTVATLLILGIAVLATLVIWGYYVTAPWTRDGRVRVQVASIAPQVSGQITDVRVVDNQFVHKGDVLYGIDPFDFQVSLDNAKAQARMKAADLQVKRVQAQRRQSLSNLATTPEEQQQYAGNATQADAAFQAAQVQVSQAEINLQRTQVKSPVNGFVTNLLMRVGDYAREATSNISIIDADSYWIDGYFEETKMARVCVGDRAEAQLMGYAQPIVGRVASITRGISVSDAAPSTQGLPNVDAVYTWVRLAQRVPVRIAITSVPTGVPLVSGMTATVTIRSSDPPQADGWLRPRLDSLRNTLNDMVHQPQASPDCMPPIGVQTGTNATIPTLEPAPGPAPEQINPGLAPGMALSPRSR